MTLAETLAIRVPGGATVPLLEIGAPLPATKRETLSTARDDQADIRCELVTLGASTRSVAFVEVAVPRGPRGVAQAQLVVRVDAGGSVQASLEAAHGSANASFSVRTAS